MRTGRSLSVLFLLLAGGLLLGHDLQSTAAPPPGAPISPGGGPTATPTPSGSLTAIPSDTATLTASATPPAGSATATATASATPPVGPPPGCVQAWEPGVVPDIGQLYNISAAAPNAIWAVGARGIVHYDGAAWYVDAFPTPVRSPLPGTPGPVGSFFVDVAAAPGAPNSAWAVGNTWPGSGLTGSFFDLPLAEHWDGAAWHIIAGPSARAPARPSGGYASYGGVAAIDSARAFAVSAWRVNANPVSYLDLCTTTGCTNLASAQAVWLTAVDAVSSSEAWLVGQGIYHYSGGVLAPAQWPGLGAPVDVAVLAQDDVWAVGNSGTDQFLHTLILHWDGTTWNTVAGPDIGPLSGVAARAPNDVWAVGSLLDGGILHWDGTAWTLVAQPGDYLSGVVALAPHDAWAVGDTPDNKSLVLHYTAQAFADVPVTQTFYPYVQWLGCRGVISGYQCGGPGEPCAPLGRPYFRPGGTVTRAQLLKMVVNAAGWPLVTPPTPTFADVDAGTPFYAFIETGVSQGIISGYQCGGPGEPCDPQRRPYFRPAANITRGQLSKVITLARGYPIPNPPSNTFADVPAGQPFYGFVEAMAAQGIVSGYTCGGPGEPCDPQSRPYFRPGASATRGQVSKFVTLAYGGP